MGRSEQDKLNQFYRKHKRMPSYAEVADLFGYASKNAAYKLINRLISEGAVERDTTGALIPKKLSSMITLAGYVEAGPPSVAEAASLDTISLDDDIVRANNVTYALKVKGDSMVDAGIYNGDLVLVERVTDAPIGSIVVANIDDEWTLKYLRQKNGKRYLEAANPDYPDLHPEQSLSIGGVVRAVIRQY